MLKLAYQYIDYLQEKYVKFIQDTRSYYYYAGNSIDYDLKIFEDDWECLQYVSIDKNNDILGYLCAEIDRYNQCINNLQLINFNKTKKYIFSKDVFRFIDNIFNSYYMYKIKFSVIVGNTSEKIYDKYIERYCGKIVGIYENDILLRNGDRCDRKIYEISRIAYLYMKKLII